MGKEEYYVQRGGKWVKVNMGDDSDDEDIRPSKSKASEEYYVNRGGKWVKIGGVKSKEDLVAKFGGGQYSQPPPSRTQYREEVRVAAPQPQTIIQAPQEPLEYKEYFITVNPRPPEPEPLPPPQPRRENEYVERPRPLQRHRLPPEPAPIIPQQRPIVRAQPPPPPNIYHIHNHHYPPPREPTPPPLPPPPPPPEHIVWKPRTEWDAFERGRRAYLAEAGGQDYDDDDDEVGGFGPPRTTPAPGYYLAGYLYYGDPSQAPELRPMS